MKSNLFQLSFLFLGLTFLIVTESCNNGKVVGGPCTYDITKSPATVVLIRPITDFKSESANGVNEVFFIVDKNGSQDTLVYSKEFSGYASNADLQKFDLKVGNQFAYVHEVIKTGTCTPDIYILTMDKYMKP